MIPEKRSRARCSSPWRGRRTGTTFRAGDKVYVDVESVDRFKRQIDFRLADCAQPLNERGESGFAGAKIADARKAKKSKSYKEFSGRGGKGGRRGGGKGGKKRR